MKWRMPRLVSWATPYPFARDTADALLAEGHCDNFGLLMDRYLAYTDERGKVQLLREFNNRQALEPDFRGLEALIRAHQARWQRTAAALGATVLFARPEWRVIVGLGTHELLGGGITVHPVYGFPILPASALKGICRAYAERVLDQPADRVDRLLGCLRDDAGSRGDLVFLDAVPAGVPRVERDVINPVFAAYYLAAHTPPADYLSPRPIFFLAVGAESLYSFAVGSLSGDPEAARQGREWLSGALQEIGVGAKTAAGYGYWVLASEPGSGAEA